MTMPLPLDCPHMPTPLFAAIDTPALLLDQARMDRNIERMQRRMDTLGVRFRPHAKTSKCVQVVRRQLAAGARGITVSTLKEAEQFHAAGIDDILYAVAISSTKFAQAHRLMQNGLTLTLLAESADVASQLSRYGIAHGVCFDVLIEVDTDGHRSGVEPEAARLLEVARALRTQSGYGAQLVGVLTHAGNSYGLHTHEALVAMAEQERSGCVRAARRLREAGFACPVVSVGSTPTALSARSLKDVTEVRAGVYVFFDLVMAGVGVCTPEDIALSVLCTVIGHRPDAKWIITDAGWMAVSRDRGTQKQAQDYGYGMVCDATGLPVEGLVFNDANQEHGVLAWRGDAGIDLEHRFPVGSQFRIIPNHACATGAQHDAYQAIASDGVHIERWSRFNHW